MTSYRIDKTNEFIWCFIPQKYGLEEIDSNVIDLGDRAIFQIDNIEYEVNKNKITCGYDGYDKYRQELIPAWDWGNIIKCWCSANNLEFKYDPNTHLYYTTNGEGFMEMMGRKNKVEIMALDNTPIFDEQRFTTGSEFGIGIAFVRVVKRKRDNSRNAYFI